MTDLSGPFRVVRHWTRWSIEDVLDPWKPQPVYDTEGEAQTEADRRNAQHAPRQPKPGPLNTQEATD